MIHPGSTVVVRGAIAAGKTRLLEALEAATIISCGDADTDEDRRRRRGIIILREPVDGFTDVRGAGNLLEAFYADQRRNALALQMCALSTRILAWRRAGVCFSMRDPEGPVVVLERNLDDDHVFAEVQLARGNMSALEFAVYENAYDAAVQLAPCMHADGLVYVDTPFEVCTQRQAERARVEETGGAEDPQRAAVLNEYYRAVWDATRASVKSRDTVLLQTISPGWAHSTSSATATLAALLLAIETSTPCQHFVRA